MLVILSLIFLIHDDGSLAHAEAVTTHCVNGNTTHIGIDMRSEFGSLRDQDSTGSCYAFGAADQLTYWAVKNNISGISWDKDSRVSATALDFKADGLQRRVNAYKIKKLNKQSNSKLDNYLFKDGGNPFSTLMDSLNSGVCLEKDIPSEDVASSTGFSITKQTQNALNDYLWAPTDQNLCSAESLVKRQFPSFLGDIKSVLQKLSESAEDPIEKFLTSCRPIYLPKESRPQVMKILPIDSKAIDEALTRGQPVGISYNPEFFEIGGVRLTELETKDKSKNRPTGHYSIIVGTRFNCETGKEEYILRNSWGASACRQSRSNYWSTSSKDRNVLQAIDLRDTCIDNCPVHSTQGPNTCVNACIDRFNAKWVDLNKPQYSCDDDGHYFVPKDLLLNNSFGANYLE